MPCINGGACLKLASIGPHTIVTQQDEIEAPPEASHLTQVESVSEDTASQDMASDDSRQAFVRLSQFLQGQKKKNSITRERIVDRYKNVFSHVEDAEKKALFLNEAA